MILVINVTEPEKLYEVCAEGLRDGSVVAIYKVHPDDVSWLRPDTMVRT